MLTMAPLWIADFVGRADEEVDRKEAAALLRDLSRADLAEQPLVRDVLQAASKDFNEVLARLQEDPRTYRQGLEDTRKVLDSKADVEEGEALKRQLLGVGVHVARSSGPADGKVSEEEKERLASAATMLGISPSEILEPRKGRA